ncbi:hypothetical protein M2133_000444 [Parabacteroides sp. PF5-6]|nr:hypothetical protein [Parabacteroides sp. PF5-6]
MIDIQMRNKILYDVSKKTKNFVWRVFLGFSHGSHGFKMLANCTRVARFQVL